MPIATEFELTFGCAHVGTIDLSALPADRRGGRIAYLQDKGLCGDCFEATRVKRRELERTSWVTARRKEEDALAAQWARDERYAPLAGSAKQVAFAALVRFDLMHQLYGWAVREQHDLAGYERVEQTAKGIDTARWWLDQRPLVADRIADLVELLDAAASTHDGTGPIVCENTA
jgi:hypothetical protein